MSDIKIVLTENEVNDLIDSLDSFIHRHKCDLPYGIEALEARVSKLKRLKSLRQMLMDFRRNGGLE